MYRLSPVLTAIFNSNTVLYDKINFKNMWITNVVLSFLSKLSVTKVTNYGNGNSNGIIEDIVFFGGNIDDTVFLGLMSSSVSTSC